MSDSGWSWRSGGIAAVLHAVSVQDNVISENHGIGLFLIGQGAAVVRGNTIHSNWGAGVVALSEHRARIVDNRLWRNGWRARPMEAGIFVTSSTEVEVRGNTLAFHPFGIRVTPTTAAVPSVCAVSTLNAVDENVLIDSGDDATAVSFAGEQRKTQAFPTCANRSDRNRLWSEHRADPGHPAPTHRWMTEAETREVLATARIPLE